VRILLDHCLTRRLKTRLAPHSASTAADMGWEDLRNGKLLAEAASQFDVMLTIDKNLRNEQNLATLPVAVMVILARTNRLQDIEPFIPEILKALNNLKPCQLIEVGRPPSP